jgi:hypothetical protein
MATTSTTSASDAAAAMLAHEDTREALDDDPPQVRKRRKTKSTYARSSPLEQETQRECNNNADDTPAASTISSIPPPMQKESPETVFSISGDNEAGLLLIDISSLKHGLQHLCCRECSEKKWMHVLCCPFSSFTMQKLQMQNWVEESTLWLRTHTKLL